MSRFVSTSYGSMTNATRGHSSHHRLCDPKRVLPRGCKMN
jgi:hypothetical protein